MSKIAISDEMLAKYAVEATKKSVAAFSSKTGFEYMGYVGSALITDKGNIFTGVAINLQCGIGFCAEHSTIAEMIKNGETRIIKIAGATAKGAALSPCGRCREMMYQINNENLDTIVVLPEGKSKTLKELLPDNWHPFWDA